MQASGNLVEVDILELSESPWPGVGIFHTGMGLGRQMVKELDLKRHRKWLAADTLSLHMMRNHRRGSAV